MIEIAKLIAGTVNILILLIILLAVWNTTVDLLRRKQLTKNTSEKLEVQCKVNQVAQVLYRELKENDTIKVACVIDMIEMVEDGYYVEDDHIESWRINNKNKLTIR